MAYTKVIIVSYDYKYVLCDMQTNRHQQLSYFEKISFDITDRKFLNKNNKLMILLPLLKDYLNDPGSIGSI